VTLSRYVARRREELGLLTREVSISQTHLAGAEAEVDFGEFYATIAGLVVKCWMFVMRLSHSGKAFHVRHPSPGGVPGGPRVGLRVLREACRAGSGMTTSNPPKSGSSGAVTAPSPSGSPRCAATTYLLPAALRAPHHVIRALERDIRVRPQRNHAETPSPHKPDALTPMAKALGPPPYVPSRSNRTVGGRSHLSGWNTDFRPWIFEGGPSDQQQHDGDRCHRGARA